MSQYDPPTLKKDAEAASEDDRLFVSVIPPPDQQDALELTFFGTYDSGAGVTSGVLHAEGVLTFEPGLKAGDSAKFKVKVTRARSGNPYDTNDVEVDIKGLDRIHPGVGSAIFKGKGDLREGEGFGHWQMGKKNNNHNHNE